MAHHTPRKLISLDPKSRVKHDARTARIQEHAIQILEGTLQRRNWSVGLRDRLAHDIENIVMQELSHTEK